MWELIIGSIIVAILIFMAMEPVGNFIRKDAKTFIFGADIKENGTSANVRDLGPAKTREDCERLCEASWCKAYTWFNGRCYGLSSVPAEASDDELAMSGVKRAPIENFTVDEVREKINSGVKTVSNTLQRRLGMQSAAESGPAPGSAVSAAAKANDGRPGLALGRVDANCNAALVENYVGWGDNM